jgi:hypothetical protein
MSDFLDPPNSGIPLKGSFLRIISKDINNLRLIKWTAKIGLNKCTLFGKRLTSKTNTKRRLGMNSIGLLIVSYI